MDPLYEQRLRDEVLYLHSLWHQGPPRPAAAAPSTFTPIAAPTSDTRYHLLPPKPTQFKKKAKRTGNTRNPLPSNAAPGSTSSRGAEWPCPAAPPPTTAWPAVGGPTPEPPPLSPEEQSKLDSKRAHQRALEAVREFFIKDSSDEMGSSDDDDMDGDCSDDGDVEGDCSDDGDVEGDCSDDGDVEGDCSDERYTLLFKLFEDSKLKEYYGKNILTGFFSCLVCGAVGGKNSSKKFKGCFPLVQHSISIEKTKRRSAHRAFAQAICNLLGWNMDRLPEIVSMLSEKSGDTQGNDSGDNEDNPAEFVYNVGSAKDDTSNGKDEEVEPASDVGKNMEEVAPDGLTISDLACHDADETENQGCPRGSAAIVSNSEAEWQCPSPSSHTPSASSWTTLENSNRKALSSPEEQLILASRHAHQNALKIVHEFFRNNKSDEIDSDDDDSDDDERMGEDSGGETYNFFLKVFEESTELREYYVKNFAEGEFGCLVCGAVGGKRTGKKFKGCFPLVQHSITIAKTKKRKAHRAFGQAVCKTIGWDIDCLHNIASMLSEKTAEIQQIVAEPTSQELATVIISSVDPDADKIENLDMVHPHNGEQPSSEGSTINSTRLDADLNLEKDNLHRDNSVDPVAG